MVSWIFKAPGLFRTISALLGTAAVLTEEVVGQTDLSQGLTKATLYSALFAIVRLAGRKTASE